MQINLIPDSSVASAPTGFTAAVQAAAAIYDQDFPGNYTVNISYGWGTFDNGPEDVLTNTNSGAFSLGGADNSSLVSYSTLKSWLTAGATSSAQLTAVASLPASSASLPGGANTFLVSSAQEKALGVFSGDSGALDGSIGFNVGDANNSDDWEPAALCEIAHALGWDTMAAGESYPCAADLYRYSAPGQYEWASGQPAYFSINGGNTDLADFRTDFDQTLFSDLPQNDPLLCPFYPSATTLTSFDIEALSVIGFGVTAGGAAQTGSDPSPADSYYGGGETILLSNDAGDVVALINTGGAWDAVSGSNGTIELTSAWANVSGGRDAVDFDNGGDAASLFTTGGSWDAITGSDGSVGLTSAWANVVGGGNALYFDNGGDAASLFATGGAWDAITGSNGSVALTTAWANVSGGANTINFANDGDAASLFNTGSAWDAINGSNGSIALTNAWANVTGGGDTIDFASAGCAASLFNTGAHADTIEGASGSIGLANAAVNLPAASETISLLGAPAFGLDTISGFTSADSMAFSKSDFANWSALSSHISQSGANTLITLDANDVITLINVQASSLTSSQFSFV